ncbi:glycerol-3-phosphate dehydrogenase [Marinobacter lutaoensis]|jgi:glycerol-3-phosphate dehydrogenase|uniref:Glycerol-3-phosphate dehydrogenase n=1 Tax=Marinobacter lutaoensis TaxID=135739 RepID=A0A1V2DX05_9GAMM|nr:glycerol-3-phosphate dehydrogenase [Marinobacter lutaoensis]MBI42619.1 glycerol-3-phosphate dehydrogenase [Oceanospirillales bacterium]ONF45285.1 glycerol-3-phosphate dehydrogenase [Marinobacter lutaoensis]
METQREHYDVIVVGGGVNGTGIAMDAAGRGLKVLLCEMGDLASATSSASSKLIHGGLRYLEHYEFRLVREALAEREALLRNSPHIMRPMRFRLPHRPHLRPAWMIRTGLFLYDHLAKRELLPGSRAITFDPGGPLKPDITRGFEYSDGWVDDARLVVLTARKARDLGATVLTRTRCVRAQRGPTDWRVTLRDQRTGHERVVTGQALVNATGPWVSRLFAEHLDLKPPKTIRMVKGSHIVVPRLNRGSEAYILQNEDGRIVFVIPYEDSFSLVGTTDVDYHGDPGQARISKEEIRYLLAVVNAHFRHPLTDADIVWSYSGVRPLLDDEREAAQKASRDYRFELDRGEGQAPLLSVFGGKITTYRKLAEAATDKLCRLFPHAGPRWTRSAPLPGGDFSDQPTLTRTLQSRYPWLPESLLRRYVRSYGTLTRDLLRGCHDLRDLGQRFTGNLYQAEVDYLVREEWALTAEDILWRRTKQGLYASESETEALARYLARPEAAPAPPRPAPEAQLSRPH